MPKTGSGAVHKYVGEGWKDGWLGGGGQADRPLTIYLA